MVCKTIQDGRYFVSCGEADRLLKLWSRRDHEGFAYLPKPDQARSGVWGGVRV